MAKLTDRQRAFCEHLNRGGSATEAARKAGYSESYANREALQLLDKPQVREYMDSLRSASTTAAVADGTEVREYLTRVMRDQVQDVATGGKELEYIHTPMPAAERTKAAQELAKLNGLYAPTRVDVTTRVYGVAEDWVARVMSTIEDVLGTEAAERVFPALPPLELDR